MSETGVAYSAGLLQTLDKPAKLEAQSGEMMQVSRAEWVDLERQLISLLVTVQRAMGKEPSVITRSERRRG